MNLADLAETEARRRGITVRGLLSEARLPRKSFEAFLNGRNKTEPALRTCARLLTLQERCGLSPALTFEIDGRRVAVLFDNSQN